NADGSLSRYKAWLVANGSSQQQRIDCDENFSLVFNPGTIHTVLSLAVSQGWPIHQPDVKNAFLHSHLSETVYMHQPPGFVDSCHHDYVYHLQRSLSFLSQLFSWYFYLAIDFCPIDIESKIGSDGTPISDHTLLRSLAGDLQYLTFTRSDLSYAGQQLYVSSTAQLTSYTDVDWAGCPVTRRSTSRYCVFLGENLLSWSAKRQVTFSCYSDEAEYRGVANVVVYYDNVSVVYMSANLVQHQLTKHIEIDIHLVRDFVAKGKVYVLHVPSRF
nr:ribonuclease H-like domain-containing protein [Tanacetum cinerariifolium]